MKNCRWSYSGNQYQQRRLDPTKTRGVDVPKERGSDRRFENVPVAGGGSKNVDHELDSDGRRRERRGELQQQGDKASELHHRLFYSLRMPLRRRERADWTGFPSFFVFSERTGLDCYFIFQTNPLYNVI